MSTFVLLAFLVCALLVLATTLSAADKALEGSILAHFRINHACMPGAWMRSFDLAEMFGFGVYPHLRTMEKKKLIESVVVMFEGVSPPRKVYFYRLRTETDEDLTLEKLAMFPEEAKLHG